MGWPDGVFPTGAPPNLVCDRTSEDHRCLVLNSVQAWHEASPGARGYFGRFDVNGVREDMVGSLGIPEIG